MRSPVKWVERSKTKTRTDGQRPRTALRRPAIQCSGGIALNPPARIPGRLTSGGLVGSARIAPSDSLRPAVWPVYHIPADKLLTCFDNFRMPTDLRELLAIVRQSLAGVRTTLYSSASSPSAIAHARNARAAPRALALPDIFSRRRTTRSRLYGTRGPTYVRANSAASSRVRTVTTRTRR